MSLKSVGFSTSALHTVHSFIRQWLWQVHLFSLTESSNVISVVSKAQWKSYILKCMKGLKSHVCYQHIGKCLALVFCRTVFVSWWRVYLLASSCLNWCLVEHSSVKTRRHLLVCPPPPFHLPPPHPPLNPTLQKYPFWCLQGCLQCLHFLSVWAIQNSSPSPPFSLPSGVCVKCTLPWFFFIQYSVTCLCKFGLEKNKSFYETICPGNCSMASALRMLKDFSSFSFPQPISNPVCLFRCCGRSNIGRILLRNFSDCFIVYRLF